MTIETKGWTAQNDKLPGSPTFRVQGTVTVAHGGLQPVLQVRAMQDKSMALALELTLENLGGMHTQAVCDKPVSFVLAGGHDGIPKVDIFHEGGLIARITQINVTH
ncbi:hypothetical protein CCOS865_00166 [Pseudomonas reidholzensis]|uniref:Uncharacterized protein n=1 Tax=Pseudomonas reidholzensis TaxID=1785162 RepID=A0A383RM16_9PSED|nr:hypothetical protein [Pseudomonas reidholzensis]SYX87945.1 hypothetical protein CCOS865_00166 [Pseudomonas reidholzensis]